MSSESVTAAGAAKPSPRHRKGHKRIAALVTAYHMRSHPDNFVTRFLEGYWINDQFHEPPCEIAALYVEQQHPGDISKQLSRRYGFPIVTSIADALTLGTGALAVDGILLIAEHGDYAVNVKNQRLYPRYRFLQQIVEVFRRSGRTVPVFVDKHLSSEWTECKQMYDWSRELGFALMAGSSLPVTFRRPELDFPLDTGMKEVVAVGGPWVEDGGLFHVIETLQCFAERRRGGESGLRSVELLAGDPVWEAAGQGRWNRDLLAAALARSPFTRPGRPEDYAELPVACLLEYNDGFRGAALALDSITTWEYVVAVQLDGQPEPHATRCFIPIENSNNFSPLVHSIARMFETGRPSNPVERTLLTSGALAFLMESWHQGQRRIETPMLDIRYRAPEKAYYARGEGS